VVSLDGLGLQRIWIPSIRPYFLRREWREFISCHACGGVAIGRSSATLDTRSCSAPDVGYQQAWLF
jgi:hypothetical protein